MMKQRRASRPLWAALAAAFGAAALLIAGCSFSDPFSPYNGVNLISTQGFDSGQWGVVYGQPGVTTPPGVTNGWQYLTFTAVTASTAGLPSASAPVYRLEIPNLVPNGDFEDSTAQVSAWSGVGSPFLPTYSWDNTAGHVIAGHSLSFSLTATNSMHIDYSLLSSGTTPLLDGLVQNARYRFLFDFEMNGSSPAVFDLNDGAGSLLPASDQWIIPTPGAAYGTVYHFPTDTSLNPEVTFGNATTVNFSVGQISAANAEVGELDNFRTTRADIDDFVHLAVPYGSSARSNLIPGTYEFSVWVKLEDSTQVTPAVANAYNADGITLGINTARAAYSIADLNLSSSSWTNVSMKAFVQIDTSLKSTDTALDLCITPTNINSKDVGRLLVSTPTLTFLPNG